METIKTLQEWFISQCNGEWEHRLAISITTMDNPGWRVTIDLNKNGLAHRSFSVVAKNVSQKFMEQAMGKVKPPFICEEPLADEWMTCFVKDGKFTGVGDALRLNEILCLFLEWAKPKYKSLKVGDKIRILGVPKIDLDQRAKHCDERQPGEWTADTYELILKHQPVITVTQIDDKGNPWFDVELPNEKGKREQHSLMILDDNSWERC